MGNKISLSPFKVSQAPACVAILNESSSIVDPITRCPGYETDRSQTQPPPAQHSIPNDQQRVVNCTVKDETVINSNAADRGGTERLIKRTPSRPAPCPLPFNAPPSTPNPASRPPFRERGRDSSRFAERANALSDLFIRNSVRHPFDSVGFALWDCSGRLVWRCGLR